MDGGAHAFASTAVVEVLVETTDPQLRERLLVECVHAMGLARGVALLHPSEQGWSLRVQRGSVDLPKHLQDVWLRAGEGPAARALLLSNPYADQEDRQDEVQSLLFLLTVLGVDAEPLAPLPAAKTEEERIRRHDLRNALHAVTSTHELLKRFGAELPTEERERFERSLEDECARVSRMAVGSTHPGSETLSTALEAVLLAERAPCALERIELLSKLPDTTLPPSVLAPDAAARVLQNLLVNAREALAGRGGRIEVQLCTEGELWCLTVDDNGPGIAPDLSERLFTQGASNKGHGRGSGLASIAAQLQALGGSAVAGRSKLGGARFALRWPVMA